jgi:hypothetical protein
MFIERSLVGPSFAVYLLAGYGSLFLVRKLSEYGGRFLERGRFGYSDSPFLRAIPAAAVIVVLFVPAIISAANSVRDGKVLEPYDQVSEYLASVEAGGPRGRDRRRDILPSADQRPISLL